MNQIFALSLIVSPSERTSSSSCSDGTSYASVCAHCPLSCHWAPLKRVWPYPPDTHPSDICKYMLGALTAFSSSGWTSPAPSASPRRILQSPHHPCSPPLDCLQ